MEQERPCIILADGTRIDAGHLIVEWNGERPQVTYIPRGDVAESIRKSQEAKA